MTSLRRFRVVAFLSALSIVGAGLAAAPAADALPAVVDGPFTVSPVPSGQEYTFHPSIAHDPEHDRYVAVFTANSHPITPYAVAMGSDGRPTGPPVRLGDSTESGDNYSNVAYNPTTDQYLVVWPTNDGENDGVGRISAVFGQLLNSDGARVGGNIRMTARTGNNYFCGAFFPAIAYQPGTGGYAMSWVLSQRNGVASSTCGPNITGPSKTEVRISTYTGAVVKTNDAVLPNSTKIELARPQIAVNPVTSELLVAWSMEDIIGTPAVEAGTVAHRASPTGAPIGDEIVVDLEAAAFAGFDGYVAADPLTGNWLVYAGNLADGPRAHLFSSTGVRIGNPISTGGTLNVDAVATGDGGWVLSDRGGITELGSTGAIVGQRVTLSGGDTSIAMGTGHGGRRVVAVWEGSPVRDVQGTVLELKQGLRPLASPTRILDTRSGLGAPKRPVAQNSSIDLKVTGVAGIPETGIGAVVLNVTATGATANGFVTVWPSGEMRPLASALNVLPGVDTPNLVIAKVGAGGKVSLYNSSGSVDLIADVAGWYPLNDGFVALTPERLLDTREGVGAPAGAIGAGGSIDLQVAGRGGVPATGVGAVVLNVTATDGTAAGFVTAWPTGEQRPTASVLNVQPNVVTPNLVIAKVGAGGRVSLFNSSGSVHLIADVAGWYPALSGLNPLTPERLLDTRIGLGAPLGSVGPGGVVVLKVTGRGGVPATGAGVVVLNITATDGTQPSFITAWPTDEQRPTASVLNIQPGVARPNLVVAKVAADGTVSLYNLTGNVDLIADVAAWMPT